MPEVKKLVEYFTSLTQGVSLKPGQYKITAKTWEVRACVCIPGVTFAFDKSFIRPSVVDSLKALQKAFDDHPDAMVFVFGHTDKVGSEQYNKDLSDRRAKSAYAFVTNDTAVWESLYNEEKWGTAAVQEILADLGYYKGPLDGKDTPATKQALKDFQIAKGQTDTGNNDQPTRELLFTDYMTGKHDVKIAKERFLEPKFTGCGEFNPKIDTEKEEEKNRRVSFFLFDPGKVPKIPCKVGDMAPCKKMIALPGPRKKKEFKCAFFDNVSSDCGCEGGGKPVTGDFYNIVWDKAEAVCGDKAKLTAETKLNDGTDVQVRLKPKKGTSPFLKDPPPVKVASGKISLEWEVRNVSFLDDSGDFCDAVEIDASIDSKGGVAANAAPLKVLGLSDAPEQTFDENRKWGQYTNHSHFKQRLEGFKNIVDVDFDVVKAWGGYWVDLSSAGIKGTAGGTPWDGVRWARSTGKDPMTPDEYYDGKKWVALPKSIDLDKNSELYSAVGFYEEGGKYKLCDASPGQWPETFAPYDFDSEDYRKKRKAWKDETDNRWTGKFGLRRNECKSEKTNYCCLYGVEVGVEYNVVKAWKDGVIAFCAGYLRSNAGAWFMDDPDLSTAPHEAGHHLDNPDEYTGGAVDPKLNGDGAKNGIDTDSLMGQNMTKVKKRHYHAFATMLGKLVSKAYKKNYKYEVVD